MTRPAAFRSLDITRILKGAKAAGMSVSTIEVINPTGRFLVRFGSNGLEAAPSDNDNEWDEVLDRGKTQQPPAQRH